MVFKLQLLEILWQDPCQCDKTIFFYPLSELLFVSKEYFLSFSYTLASYLLLLFSLNNSLIFF